MSGGVERHDVVVVGGGPGGASAAGFLARAGRRVVLVEREAYPRFHIGESLLPASLPLLDRLGVLGRVAAHGFQVKYGAMFHDQGTGRGHSFYFARGQPWPHYAYQVPRAEFDRLLLDHARGLGVDVRQPATAEAVTFDADGVGVEVRDAHGSTRLRGQVLVDASGRDGFLAARLGRRERVPNLGKVALFAHFRGADRAPGIDEGSIRIAIFEDGWFWWIPFAGDVTSVGCVLHARTVRGWAGAHEALFDAMIGRCRRVADGLKSAERVTPIHAAANFAYVNRPMVGDRHVCVGDAVAFVDPIFSGGVHIALQSGELAAQAVGAALGAGRFEAARFAGYERAFWRGVRPFFRMIHRYYEPVFLELLLAPRNYFGMVDAVLSVLAGGTFVGVPWRTRAALELLFAIARAKTWIGRRAGRPVESRLEW
jgi:flavin-dependent dehydrogenase